MTKKLLDFFPDLLTEASAGEEAKKRGLKSIGFGRYVDPSDPKKVVAKSKNGKLVSVGQTAPSHMKGKEADRFNKRARAFDDDDIGGAMAQVKDIEKRNNQANPKGEKRVQHKMLSNIFGKSAKFNKIVTTGGQTQMWWEIEDLSMSPSRGLSGAFMSNKGQQWQRNKIAKIKKAIATNPELAGWQPVFRQDRNLGGVVNLIMVKE